MIIHIEDYFEMDNNNETLPYYVILQESFIKIKRNNQLNMYIWFCLVFTLKVAQVFPWKFYYQLENIL